MVGNLLCVFVGGRDHGLDEREEIQERLAASATEVNDAWNRRNPGSREGGAGA